MRTVTFPHRFFATALFVLVTAGSALSQSDRGTITGSILDSSGGAIEGAAITATGVETGTVYQTISTSTGAYRFSGLVLGHYNISVTAKGFKVSTATGVEVQINSTASLDITLQPGDVKESVTVLADAPTIETGTSEMGTVVGSKEILELPLSLNSSGQSFLRSPETFVFLAPGTQGPGTNQNGSNSSGIFESKLSGGQNFGTEVLLDGVSTTRSDSGSAFDQTAPSVEVLSEFKVLTSTFSAEYGRTSGGIESFSTKSGTLDFHGTAFDLFRNTALDSNSWDNNLNGQPRPPDHQNDFGGSLGGPVWIPKLYDGRHKTFFFFSWEQYRNNPGTTSVTTLPTTTEIQNGNFSALLGAPVVDPTTHNPVLNPCDNTPVLTGQIFNPFTTSCPTGFVGGRVAFPGNIVPPGMFDSVAKKILSFLTVSPNLPGTNNGLQNNFVFRSSQQQRDTTMSFRIDQNWGTKNKFFFSYSSRDQETPAGADTLPGVLNPNFFNSNFTHYLRGGWDYTIAPNLLNTFTVGFNRLNNLSKADSVNGTDWPAALGIGNAHGLVFPQISFNGSPLGIGYQGFSTESFNGHVPNSLVLAENLRWIKGRHSFDFGFEWRAYQYSFIAQGDTSPNYGFSNFQTAFAPNNPSTGDPFASFLLGVPSQEQLSDTLANPRLSSYYYATYVQDDFKIRRDLTLNLGLRYDVDTPRHEDHGDQSSLNLNIPNPGAPGENGALQYGSASNQGTTYYKDFGPRIGFAYAPTEMFGHIRNMVIRGGYAIYYAALFYDDLPTGTIQFSNGNVVQPTFTSQDAFTPVQSPSAGFPNFAPPVNSTDPSRLNGQNVGYIAPSYGRPAMTQNWSIEVQKQLAQDLIFSVGYVGVDGSRLHTNIAQVNALNPKFYNLGTALTDSVTSPAGQAVLTNLGVTVPSWFVPLYGSNALVGQLLRPFPQYLDIGGSNNGMCSCLENLGVSTYNAFQAKLERRFRNGINLLASYTFSKTLTNADSALPVFSGFQSNEFAAQDPFNPKTQKAPSFQDTPHMLVVSYIYELPVGRGKKYLTQGVASKVLGGWQIGGVQRYQSGTPTIFGTNAPSAPFTDGAFRYSLVPGQPLLAPNRGLFNPQGANSGCTEQANGTFTANSTNNYFNCAAFLDPNAPALVAQRGYVYGNAPLILGNVRSQPYFNEDFSILKRTAINEKQSIIFKVDIPNAFNRHVFDTLNGSVTSATFGAPSGNLTVVSPVRQIQLTLRYQF
jgi:Carboxypeptidase regulatory-like domain